jgi:hypothetical protein
MDPINPWIDPNETRRMAERLMQPAREPVQAPEDTGFDDSFVGFSDSMAEEFEVLAPELDQIEEPEELASSAQVTPELEDSAPYPEHHAMLRDQFGAIASFMTDANGELVFTEGGYGAFQFVAQNLAKSAAPPNHLRLKIGANAVLEIIPIESETGFAWLGVIFPALLPQDVVGQIRLHWLGVQ